MRGHDTLIDINDPDPNPGPLCTVMMTNMTVKEEQGIVSQDAVIEFLENPESYDPRPEQVERIDTHGAVVFLAGAQAFKMKRAVKLPYLDFSTLEKRRRICRHEIERNRVTAPDLYRDVVPVLRTEGGSLSLKGDGVPVEWLVRMLRFDQAQLFDRLAETRNLDLALMGNLARLIAAYHCDAQRLECNDGRVILQSVADQVIAACSRPNQGLKPNEAATFSRDLGEALSAGQKQLDKRAGKGFVRLCHGDLHLKNIVLHDGRPMLFDAIEFDDGIATIDVLYDLAFLMMDLWSRGLKRHANVVLNRYLVASGESENISGLALLPLFLSLRAGVRAMVASDLLAQIDPAKAQEVLVEIRHYFDLAASFLRSESHRLVVIGGRSGTGKSTLSADLAPSLGRAPGALHVRSDVERKSLLGVSETERLDRQGYTKAITDQVYSRLLSKAETALSAGHSVILDAVYLRPDERRAAELLARRTDAAFTGIWLEASEQRMKQRVEARVNDASDADVHVVEMQSEIDAGPINWHRVQADAGPHAVCERARKIVAIDRQLPAV